MKYQMDEIEINIQNFQSLIENYEKFIHELTNELNIFKSEHEVLKTKTSVLIEENNRISQEHKDLLRLHEKYTADHTHPESELITNLKKQIETTVNEKEYTVKLWQNAVQTIDILEDELKAYQAGTQDFIPKKDVLKMKTLYEEKIKHLERKLLLAQEKLQQTTNATSKELDKKSSEIEKSLENQSGILKIIKNLEEEILNLQRRLQNSTETKLILEKKLKTKDKVIDNVKEKNAEYRTKVQEAVQVVEAALNEKDAALLREKTAKEELEKMSKTLSEIILETESKIKNDIIVVKNEYNEKLKTILNDMKKCQNEVNEKVKEIEKYYTKCSFLESEIERLQKGNLHIDDSNTSKLLLLEKNLESTFQKLLLSEKQNIQLNSQMESIKNDMEQMGSHYERVIKTKEIERTTLENKIKNLKTQLDYNSSTLTESVEKVASLNIQIQNLQKEYEENIEKNEKLKITFTEKICDLNSTHNQTLKKFQDQLESQVEINKKWRVETKVITENLEKLIAKLKSEIYKLRRAKNELLSKCQESEGKINEYKTFLQLISKDVNKISSLNISFSDAM